MKNVVNDPAHIDAVVKNLDLSLTSTYTASPVYGIIYKGKLLLLTKARVYRQAGRARAELVERVMWSIYPIINKGLIYTDPSFTHQPELRKIAKSVVQELEANGTVEIQLL